MEEMFNSENRNGFNIRNRVRCCSFCRREGHNIALCDDIRIHDFHLLCLNTIENIILNYNNPRFKLYNWLCEFSYESLDNQLLIKAYAIKHFRTRSSEPIYNHIERIFNWYCNFYSIPNNTNNITNTNNINSILSLLIDSSLDLERNIDRNMLNYIRSNIKLELLSSIDLNNLEKTNECNICYQEYKNIDFIQLNCNHNFCKKCIIQQINNIDINNNNNCCALCRCDIKTIFCNDKKILEDLTKELLIL
jgi:hypothetical protein